jgi:prepilin-type N-terminal cleavage/methylation domain-containing protein/prepilin-type processing-associated H-X9-DG protein
MVPRKACRHGFTLIELLVVIAIIALLIALIVPGLAGSREAGRRIACASNLRQYSIGLTAYAADYKQHTPTQFPLPGYGSNMFACNGAPLAGTPYENPTSVLGPGWWDLREMLKSYLTSLGILNCPSLKTTPVTDPENTRAACYYAYDYYGGRGQALRGPAPFANIQDRWPDFGLRNGVPEDMDLLNVTPSSMPLTQDRLYYDASGSGATANTFIFNHGSGNSVFNAGSGRPSATDVTNPSHAYRASSDASDVGGSNVAFYDGHAAWYALRDMDVVGGWHAPPNGNLVMTISKLPTRTSSPISISWPLPPGVFNR